MRASRLSTITILFACSLSLAATAFAAKTNKKTIHLYEKARLQGVMLYPGDYKVEWSGPGPDVRLDIVQNGATLATVPAQVTAEDARHDHDGYVLGPAKSGGQAIREIFFSGTKYDLKINSSGKTS